MSDEFLACDWGTSHLRVQCFDRASGTVVGESHGDDGVARLAATSTSTTRAARFAAALRLRIDALEAQVGRSFVQLPIVISGMASSSIGWQELPYARVPLALDGSGLVWRKLDLPMVDAMSPQPEHVILLSGACTDSDVMRGEETQIVGLAELSRREPEHFVLIDKATLILPGTHSKHVELAGGELRAFRTFMTGELYALLTRHSVLQHSVTVGEMALSTDAAQAAFSAGVTRGAQHGLTGSLFGVRTRHLLQGVPADDNACYLSGLLIGDELVHVVAGAAAERPIVLAAAGALAVAYRMALVQLKASERVTVLPESDVVRLAALGQSRILDELAIHG